MRASKVIFDEVEHTYHLNGKKLQGITGTLIPHAIGKKYADVPYSILIPAMKKGKRVHREIEMYLKTKKRNEKSTNPTSRYFSISEV